VQECCRRKPAIPGVGQCFGGDPHPHSLTIPYLLRADSGLGIAIVIYFVCGSPTLFLTLMGGGFTSAATLPPLCSLYCPHVRCAECWNFTVWSNVLVAPMRFWAVGDVQKFSPDRAAGGQLSLTSSGGASSFPLLNGGVRLRRSLPAWAIGVGNAHPTKTWHIVYAEHAADVRSALGDSDMPCDCVMSR
jgi:hypothetical protein